MFDCVCCGFDCCFIGYLFMCCGGLVVLLLFVLMLWVGLIVTLIMVGWVVAYSLVVALLCWVVDLLWRLYCSFGMLVNLSGLLLLLCCCVVGLGGVEV